MATKPRPAFTLTRPNVPETTTPPPPVRLKPSYYQLLRRIKAETGIPMGTIVEQCIDYALDNMDDREEE